MSIWNIILLVAFLGAVGGLTNAINSGELTLPRLDKDAGIWRPGWIGNLVTGATAAAVAWGVYGPMGSFDIPSGEVKDIRLSVAQLLMSLVVGFGGGKFLTMASQTQSLKVANGELAKQMDSIKIIGPTNE